MIKNLFHSDYILTPLFIFILYTLKFDPIRFTDHLKSGLYLGNIIIYF